MAPIATPPSLRAKRSNPALFRCGRLDCFGALRLAMTVDAPSYSRGADRVRAMAVIAALTSEGAGKTGRWPRPWPACRKKRRRQSPQVWPKQPGLPCTMGLRLIRALPGDRRSCPRHWHRRQLGISTGMPGPHDFAVLSVSFVRSRNSALQHRQAIASHPACRDDREAPLVSERDGATIHLFRKNESKIFLPTGLDSQISLSSLAKIAFWADPIFVQEPPAAENHAHSASSKPVNPHIYFEAPASIRACVPIAT